MQTWTADSSGAPEVAWALMSRPRAWPAWAPHVQGAWGLAGPDGEVREHAHGAARLLGAIPVPARIVAKVPGRSWTWRVGPGVDMTHRVEPRTGGCRVAIDVDAPGPLEAAIALSYGPVIGFTLRRLARAAERRASPPRRSPRASSRPTSGSSA
jgi:hypothetical protein